MKETMKVILALFGIEKPDYSMTSIHRIGREVDKFVSDPGNTFLVSFPRTGSHWLRMLMELYFERPSLTEIYYYSTKRNYLTLHTHDIPGGLFENVERSDVIYLYRDPVETIYSQLSFHKEPLDSLDRIKYWSEMYGNHMSKWLHTERFTTHKTILTYEGMKKNLAAEFKKVTDHFNVHFDPDRIETIANSIEKSEIKSKVTHNPQVINLQSSYTAIRNTFKQTMTENVWKYVLKEHSYLKDYLTDIL